MDPTPSSVNRALPEAAPATAPAAPPRRGEAVVVWAVWLVMTASVLVCIGVYGRNVPLAEDWLMVPSLTGHEPSLLASLWEQNNEHRLPLPRALYLTLLKLTHGDFRSGMVANVLLMAAMTAALMLVARQARGGATRWADAFFPLLLLHLGHWNNLVWSWQIQFALSSALAMMLLVWVAMPRRGPGTLVAMGGVLTLMPLTGGNGLMVAGLMGPWVLWDGFRHWRWGASTAARRAGLALMLLVALAGAVSVLYLVGYARPPWAPPSPGREQSLETAARITALAFGPAAVGSWTLATLALAAVVTLGGLILLHALLEGPRAERTRAAGLLAFILTLLLMGLVTGHARAGWVPSYDYPHRYAMLFAPVLAAIYLAWVLYGLPRLRGPVLAAFAVGMLLLVPLNTKRGYGFRDWYVAGMADVQRDIDAGLSPTELADKHYQFLLHWDQQRLPQYIQMLRDANMTRFRDVKPDAP